MRKRNLLLPVMILCFLLAACQMETPYSMPAVGTPRTLVGKDTVKIVSAQINDGEITLVLELDFQELTFSDLTDIYVRKAEAKALHIPYDEAQAKIDNSENAFTQPYSGEIKLVFRHESISGEHKGIDYCFYLTYPGNDGRNSAIDFSLEGAP